MLRIGVFGDGIVVSFCSRSLDPYLRQAKVENLGVTTSGEKNIRRLDIAVNDAFAVRGIQRVGELDRNGKKRFRAYWTTRNPIRPRCRLGQDQDGTAS